MRLSTKIALVIMLVGGLTPALAFADTSVSLSASATNTSSTFYKYLYSFPVPAGTNLAGFSGSASITSGSKYFSEALISVHYMPAGSACPSNGEVYSSYTDIYAKYPGLASVADFILKQPVSGTVSTPTQFTFPVPLPATNCIVVILDGSILTYGGSFTMASNMVANFTTGTPPSPAPQVLGLDDEFCFDLGWGCQLYDPNVSSTDAFMRVSPVTSTSTLLALYGNLSDSAFSNTAPYTPPPTGAWSMQNDYYIYHNCGLPAGVSGPANYYASIPANAINLYSLAMQGTGMTVLQQPVFKAFSNTVLVPGDCLIHLVKTNANGGIDAEDQVFVQVQATSTGKTLPPPAPTATLSANPTSITSGSSSTLSWSSTNAASCTGTGFTASGISGSVSVTPSTTTPYSVTCMGTSGSAIANATVNVTPVVNTTPPVLSGAAPTGTLPAGTTSAVLKITTNENALCSYATVAGLAYAAMTPFSAITTGALAHSVALSSLQNGQSYTYYVKCKDAAGNVSADTAISFSIAAPAPTATLSANPTSITSGSSSTLSWSSTNAASCTGTGFTASGTVGSATVTPAQTTTYGLTCTGAGGSASASASVTVQSGPLAGLLGYWPLDTSTTNFTAKTTADTSGNGYTGKLVGMTKKVSSIVGVVGQALFFNGSNTSVTFPSNVKFNGAFTFVAWVRRDGGQGGDALEIFNNNQFFIRTRPSSEDPNQPFEAFVTLSNGSVEPRAESNVSSTPGTWFQVASTWDGTTLKIYVNGALKGSSTRSGALTTKSVTPKLGDGEGPISDGNRWIGGIDDVHIYSRALSAPEIQQLYSSPGMASAGNSTNNLLAILGEVFISWGL